MDLIGSYGVVNVFLIVPKFFPDICSETVPEPKVDGFGPRSVMTVRLSC